MQTFKKLYSLLSSDERKDTVYLLLIITTMALLDVIGIASILPFMAILTNPDLVEANFFLKNMFKISNIFGVEDKQQFLFMMGILVFILLIISLIFKTITNYFQVRFVQMCEYTIGKRLFEGYLHQPYSWFLNNNSAELGKTILSEVQQVVLNGIRPMIELVAKGMIAAVLIVLLIIIDSKLAIIVGLTFGATYGLIFYIVKNYLYKFGKRRLKNNNLRFITASEAFSASKEVKFRGLEQQYVNKFSNSAKTYAQTQVNLQVIGQLPRYFLEAIAFGGIMLILLYLMTQTGSINNALPILSLYAFAGYRLIPSLQIIYSSFTQLAFVSSSLDKLHYDLNNISPTYLIENKKTMTLNKSISLKNIYYNYPNTPRNALIDINLNIPAKSKVGLVGSTGSGKTTTLDIILGLLFPQKGSLDIDGQVITNKNFRSWQRVIGYVPQNIYLSDDTVSANIAFGIDPKLVDMNSIEKSSKIANLHDFVTKKLPKKYDTIIGERGVRLSGGERQRIGIARALYHDPQVLILDEATSALDNTTEQAVMNAVNNLDKNITIILIAHRLNTVKDCDIIFKLENGKLISQGTFNELINNKN